jgi:hypothetical protein
MKLISLFGSGHTDEIRLYTRLVLRKQDYMFIVTSCTMEYTHTHTHVTVCCRRSRAPSVSLCCDVRLGKYGYKFSFGNRTC